MAGLADSVGAREAVGEHADEEGRGKTDDIEVVALDALDEGGAAALDCIAARSALPLAGAYVLGHVPRRQLPEHDLGLLVLDCLPPRREQTQTGNHDVGTAWRPPTATGAAPSIE